jgi:hypothetical protein
MTFPGFDETSVVSLTAGDVTAGEGKSEGPGGTVNLTPGVKIAAGDIITAPEGSALLMKLSGGALISVLQRGSIRPEFSENRSVIHLSEGCIISKVPSPFSGVYEVVTPDAVAAVKGTVFAVMYNKGKTSVIVSEGVVNLKHVPSGFTSDIDTGYYAEAGEEIKKRKLSTKESELLKEFNAVTDDSSSLSVLTGVYEGMIADNAVKGRMTLDDIRKKYGQIDEFVLYSGKRYTGAIISRGDKMKIQTVNGIVSVPSKDVKNIIPK